MTNSEASIIIGNLPVYGIEAQDDCYTIAEYQEAKAIAIKELGKKSCEDCISRHAAIEAVKQAIYNHDSAIMRLTDLPSVTPQPKVGEWLKNGELCKCSNCHSNVLFSAIKLYNYCYHCGARMEVEE